MSIKSIPLEMAYESHLLTYVEAHPGCGATGTQYVYRCLYCGWRGIFLRHHQTGYVIPYGDMRSLCSSLYSLG